MNELPETAVPVTCREAAEAEGRTGRPEGTSDEPTPLRYRPGERVRVNGLCDFRSLIGQTGTVVENKRFIVAVRLDSGRLIDLRHESISDLAE